MLIIQRGGVGSETITLSAQARQSEGLANSARAAVSQYRAIISGGLFKSFACNELMRTNPQLTTIDKDHLQELIASGSSRFRPGFWQRLHPAFTINNKSVVRMNRRCFNDYLVPEPQHLEADVPEAPNYFDATRILSDTDSELFVSGVCPFQTCVGPTDSVALNIVVRMASHMGVSPPIARVRLFRLRGGQRAGGQPKPEPTHRLVHYLPSSLHNSPSPLGLGTAVFIHYLSGTPPHPTRQRELI